MKIGELLRQIADVIDSDVDGHASTDIDASANIGDVTTNQAPAEFDAQAGTGESPDEVYVGPLQQKHELLKKATGVENNADKFATDDPEIAQIQANAGIQPATVIHQTIEVNPNGQQTTSSTSPVPSPVAAITMPAIGDHNDID